MQVMPLNQPYHRQLIKRDNKHGLYSVHRRRKVNNMSYLFVRHNYFLQFFRTQEPVSFPGKNFNQLLIDIIKQILKHTHNKSRQQFK